MFTITVIICLALVAWFIWRGHARAPRKHGRRLLRLPGGLPIIGYTMRLLQPRYKLFDHFASLQAQTDLKNYEIPQVFLPPMVLINDPVCLEYIFDEHELFTKGAFFRSRMFDLFGNSLINASGQPWRDQRKAGVKFLSSANVECFTKETLLPLIEAMHQDLAAAAQKEETVDLQEMFLGLMSTFFGHIAFDTNPGDHLVRAFDEASSGTYARFRNPFWQLYELLAGRSLRSALRIVKAFGDEVTLNAAQKSHELGAPTRRSLIDLFLERLPDRQTVADAATGFMSAGRDTTAQAMTWTMYELSKWPEAHSSLRKSLEANAITKCNNCGGGDVNHFETVGSQIPYAKAVFAEALRLNPSVPLNLRATKQQCSLPDGTLLQPGSIVVWVAYAMARSPAIWGADAEDFKPERWLSHSGYGNATFVPRNASEYPVFHGGPRLCIGKGMAEVVACQLLADLVLNWEFEVLDMKSRKRVGESLTAPMTDGLLVRPRRRVHTNGRE